jgi:hypothetical protein
MRCFGMAKEKCPVADVLDLKSPSVVIAAKCPRALGWHWQCCCGAGTEFAKATRILTGV